MAETELHVMVTRSFIIRIVTMYAVIIGLYRQTAITSEQLPQLTSDAAALTANPVSPELCAGTVIGQLVYSLLLVDVLISLAVEWMYYFITAKRCEDEGGADFDLPFCIMTGAYRQGFVWFGTPFCPFLPLLGAVGAATSFGEYYLLVRHYCKVPRRRTATMQTKFFVGCAGLTFVFSVVPLLFILRKYNPNCGVFRAPLFDTFFDGLTLNQDGEAGEGRTVLGDPLLLYCVIVTLCVCIYASRKARRRLKRRIRGLEAASVRLREELPRRANSQPPLVHAFGPAETHPPPL